MSQRPRDIGQKYLTGSGQVFNRTTWQKQKKLLKSHTTVKMVIPQAASLVTREIIKVELHAQEMR